MQTFTKSSFVQLALIGMIGSSIGCLPKVDTPKPANFRVNPNYKFGDLDKYDHLITSGGMPGKITIRGVGVLESEGALELDPRLSVSQTMGKGKDDSNLDAKALRVPDSKLPTFSTKTDKQDEYTLDVSSPEEKSTGYIAIGCNQLDPMLVDGLTKMEFKIEPRDSVIAQANTIIICGEQTHSTIMPTRFSADRIILIDANYITEGGISDIIFESKVLNLIGENKIQSKVNDSPSFILSASDIFLTTTETIEGEGRLEISSTGGNCIPEEPKK